MRRSTIRTLLATALVSLVPALLAAQSPAPAPPAPAPDSAAASPAIVAQGRAIFHGSGTCFACHGSKLEGGPIAPSLRGPKFKTMDGSFQAILNTIRNGVPGTAMVARPGGINDKDADLVAHYIYAVSKGKAKP